MSSASDTSSSSPKSAYVAQQLELTEDLTRKFAKIQGAGLLSVMSMFEDDADDLREQNRQVRRKLLGDPAAEEAGDDMGSRRTILADNITIYAGGEPAQPPAPATPAPVPAPQPAPPTQPSGMSTAAKLGIGALGAASLLGVGLGGYGLAKLGNDQVTVVTPADKDDPINFQDRSATIRPRDPLLDGQQ